MTRAAVISFALFALCAAASNGCSDSSSSPPVAAAPSSPPPSSPPPSSPPPSSPPPTDDLAVLSDDFDGAALTGWQRVFQTEAWGFDQLESFDVGATQPGWLTLVPNTSSWFEDYRGVLVYKEVTGDYIVTSRVVATNRTGTAAPGSQYSLAGIMVRAPRAITAATWTPGGEDYVFLSLGAASNPGTFQTEVKTTDDSTSVLEIDPAAGAEAYIRQARIGSVMICLIREAGTPWRVHRRYDRPDMPATLQVGLTVYTDWLGCQPLGPVTHNTTYIVGGTPDLRAQFDFVTYARPVVPASLAGRDLTDPFDVSDAELLAFLGN